MPDSPAVKSCRGNIQTVEWFLGLCLERLENGTDLVDPETTRQWIKAEEVNLADWKKKLDQAIREETKVEPLVP